MKTKTILACLVILGSSCEKQHTTIPPPPENSAEIAALRKQVQELTRKKLEAPTASTPTPNLKPPVTAANAPAQLTTPSRGKPLDRGILGMTEEEALAKYGAPVIEMREGNPKLKDSRPAELALTFEKDGVFIAVKFFKKRIAKAQYIRKDRSSFTKSEAEVILRNHSNLQWVYLGDPGDGQQWDTKDRTAIAINSASGSLLSVVTREFTEATITASKQALRGL